MNPAALLSRLHHRCAACGRAHPPRLPAPEAGPNLCPACAEALAPLRGGHCPACGLSFPAAETADHLCPDCLSRPPAWDDLAFHGPYEGLLRDLLLAFKLRGRLGLSGLLRALAAGAWAASGHAAPDLVAPVPLHPARLARRGFNQALELAMGPARSLGLPVAAGALSRVLDTRTQTGLSAAARVANMRGAFRADPAVVRGRRVLLVDDILTTGGTLAECCRVLRRAGVERVSVLVVARTRREAGVP